MGVVRGRRTRAALTAASLALWPSVGHAEGRVAVLVAEGRLAGPARFWWHCAAREPQPFVEGLAGELRRLGDEPVAQCTAQIHDTFKRPDLDARAATNVGSVLDADAALWGSVTYDIAAPVAALGLRHVHADARLGLVDVDSGKVSWEGHIAVDGFAPDLASALERARALALAESMAAVRTMRTEAPSNHPALLVELSGGGPTDKRLLSLDAMKRIPGVTSVRLVALALDRTVFEIEPASVRYGVAAVLAAANVQYRFVDSPSP